MWKLTKCSPHSHTQAAFEALVRKARGATKALVVAGCVPQAERRLGEQRVAAGARRDAGDPLEMQLRGATRLHLNSPWPAAAPTAGAQP